MAEPASAFQASCVTTPSSDPGSVAGKAWSGYVATGVLPHVVACEVATMRVLDMLEQAEEIVHGDADSASGPGEP
jgi:hypothetical protein